MERFRFKHLLKGGIELIMNSFIVYTIVTLVILGMTIVSDKTRFGFPILLFHLIFTPLIQLEFYKAAKENRKADTTNMLSFDIHIIKANAYSAFKIFLWTFVFIIPGIIKAFEYTRVIYIADENRDMKLKDVLKQSKEEMMGYKSSIFVANLIVGIPLAILLFALGYIIVALGYIVASNPEVFSPELFHGTGLTARADIDVDKVLKTKQMIDYLILAVTPVVTLINNGVLAFFNKERSIIKDNIPLAELLKE